MVLLEAMYYGLAVLTTDNGGSTMMIQDGVNGYRLKLDVHRWAWRIVRLYGDREQLEHMKRCAHETVADRYTWDVLGEAGNGKERVCSVSI